MKKNHVITLLCAALLAAFVLAACEGHFIDPGVGFAGGGSYSDKDSGSKDKDSDSKDNESGEPFTITGDIRQNITVFVFPISTALNNATDAANAISATPGTMKGYGSITGGTNTVNWSDAPLDGTYTIVIMLVGGQTYYKKATNVTIANGGGTVAFSSFASLS